MNPMRRLHILALFSVATLAACGDGPDPASPNRGQLADKWLTRAKTSFRNGDVDDATQAIDGALKAAPRDRETHLLAARIALSKLDFDEAIKQTEGLDGSEAKSVRGRAFWYAGDIDRAADELEDVLRDPNVKDPWARDVAKLGELNQNAKGVGMRAWWDQILQDYAAFTPLFNTTGQPAIMLPLWQAKSGLPLAMQFVGRMGDEETLYSLAGQLEQALPWSGRKPPLYA